MKKEAKRLLGQKCICTGAEGSLYERMKNEAKMFLGDKEDGLDPVQCLLGAKYRDEFENVFKSSRVARTILFFGMLGAVFYGQSNAHAVHHRRKISHCLSCLLGILTVRYNAWRYRDESQAWAGLAVEITREMEKRMSGAQRLHAPWICGGAWVLMSRSKILAGLLGFSYGCLLLERGLMAREQENYQPPPLLEYRRVFLNSGKLNGILGSVSDQINKYLLQSRGQNVEKLGYQDIVINDIKFAMEMIGTEPTKFSTSWDLRLLKNSSLAVSMGPPCKPTSEDNLRVIVFVDNIDRCQPNRISEVS
eukprot:Gb_00959 [translate_table: standard]